MELMLLSLVFETEYRCLCMFCFSHENFLHISIGRHRDIDVYLPNVCVLCIALMYKCVFLDTLANKLMASFKQTILLFSLLVQ